MQRCIQLARLGAGNVAPNPMVGAILVYGDRIIGEGYHRRYGQAHAEVNCIASVNEADKQLMSQSVLYVSLEPCAHWGKTPPCADLIIAKRIPKVVVGCRDPFVEVAGQGIEKLRVAGVQVETGILEEECQRLNKRFFTVHEKKRPYVILKWAQTLDGKIASQRRPPQSPKGEVSTTQPLLSHDANNGSAASQSGPSQLGETPPLDGLGEAVQVRLLISNEQSNRLVHKWRSEEAAILVGTNTALHDNPQLGTRLWPGNNPVRIVMDIKLRLPTSLQVFDGSIPTIIFNKHKHSLLNEKIDLQNLTGVHYYQIAEGTNLIYQLLNDLYSLNIQSILVEGGAQLLQSFIDEGLWDEARVLSNQQLIVGDGLPAPQLFNHQLVKSQTLLTNVISFYHNSGQ